MFAAVDEVFGDAFEFFPAGADGGGFLFGDFVVGGGDGDDAEEVGEFLDNHVGGGNEEIGMGPGVFWVFDEEAAGAFANPLDEAKVVGAFDEGFDAVEGVGGAAAAGFISLSPFVDEGLGEAHVGGDLLDVTFFENFAKKFVGLHGGGLAEWGAGAIDFAVEGAKRANRGWRRKDNVWKVPGKLDGVRGLPVSFFFGPDGGR